MADKELTNELSEAMRQLALSMNNANAAMDPKIRADKEAAEAAALAAQKNRELASAIGQNIVSFGKNLMSGGEGLGKFSGNVEGATDGLGNLIGKFGPLGFVVGGLVKVLGQLMGASLKQNDQLMKAYRELAESGSVAGSLESFQDSLHRVGLTTEEYAKFNELMKKNSNELAAFGGSVTAGKDKMVGVIQGMIGPGNQIEKAMARIGYGAEEMRDATANYIRLQSQLGVSQNKTEKQLRDESVKYMTTLRELQELTGMSRDEAQKVIEAQQAEYRFARYKLSLGEDERKRMEAGMAAYEKQFGKEAASDLMEQIVNRGAIVGEKSARAYQSTGNAAYENMMKVTRGTMTVSGAMIGTAKAIDKNMDNIGESYNVLGQSASSLAGTNEQLSGSLKLRNMTEEDVKKRLEQDMRKTGDRLDQNVNIEQQQRAMRIAADKSLMEIGNATVSMFEKLNDIMFKFGKFLAQTIDKISPFVLGKKTNLAEGFKEREDYQGDLNVARNAIEAAKKNEQNIKNFTDNLSKQQDKEKYIADQIKSFENMERETRGVWDEQMQQWVGGNDAQNEYAQQQIRLLKSWREQLKDSKGNITQESINAQRERQLLRNKEVIDAEEKKLQEAQKNLQRFQATSTTERDITKIAGKESQLATSDASGKQVSAEKAEQRSQARAGLGQQAAGRSDEILSKLNFKNREENIGGGEADPKLLALAERISEAFPGGTFTALNDKYHKNNRPNSEHTRGKALDFVVKDTPRDANAAAQIKEQLKDLGAAKVLDEYFTDKSDATTGGHFHVEVARQGGLFTGPNSGYPVQLHGKNESVWPEDKLKGLLDSVEKQSIEQYQQLLLDNRKLDTTSTSTPARIDDSMMDVIVTKFEDMINQLESANDTLSDLLKYAKA